MTILAGGWGVGRGRGEAFEAEGTAFAKTQGGVSCDCTKVRKGTESWSVGSKVERFEMSQKCGWEPHHVGGLWSLEEGI